MKPRQVLIAAAVTAVLVGVGAGLYTLGKQHAMQAMPATPAPARKVLYWHDPMVPAQKFDKPGPSPFMDMQLVPVYADAGDDNGSVRIDPRVQQNLGVRTATVSVGTAMPTLSAVGTVGWNERDVTLVQARANGYVEKLMVRAVLDPVRKGQPIAELYAPDWSAAQEEFLTVQRLQDASLLDGARQRMRVAGMNDAQIRQFERSGKVQARTTISAPQDGVVTELAVREGSTVALGAPLLRINGNGTVWVLAEVPESQAAQMRPGQTVEARTAALPGAVFKGRVGALLPDVNAATRTIKARIELANPGGRLLPGMFATLTFSGGAGAQVLLIPSEAVIQTGTRSIVMLAQGDGKFAPVEIRTGAESNGQTIVTQGLTAGQKVVTSAQFLIDSEASLKGTTTRMLAPAAEAGK
ncbi:Cu(I)/Ag(I) efflux system membrane fusion protein [Actimicrobium sp. GrIS 1.19]|uniref:efflux RND transporter periplasmic adaptor subunit n=1 Tax=Actimicrobium sp. GrIS 1.19 TaxID=3071708 RepID=UPI002E021B13|nr:Cu(I)/Ag(I) efflux system membrane fusion protein [Actimicrobium sp. GrIS 1.19]